MRRIFYDAITGKGLYSSGQLIEVYPNWVDGDYDMREYYFPDGVPTLRIKMSPTITGNDPAVVGGTMSFTGFPDDAIVEFDMRQFQLTDGTIDFTPTTSGSYSVLADHPAYLVWRTTINAD